MIEARPISSPMDPNQKLSTFGDSTPANAQLYRKLVGSLIWLLNTKIDISFPNGLLAGFMSTPLKTHWQVGLWILRY